MSALLERFKKKFALACMFWFTGTYIAISAESQLGEYTAFTTIVLALFKASDVADKKLNGGNY
jgi:hypothetical protein